MCSGTLQHVSIALLAFAAVYLNKSFTWTAMVSSLHSVDVGGTAL
jgi:hypothetical protein